MKKPAIYRVIVPIVFLFTLSGCQSLDDSLRTVRVQRSVENNVFSSSFPEIRLKVNQDFTYLGSARIDKDETKAGKSKDDKVGSSFEATSYLFGRLDESKVLSKGVIVRVFVARGDPNQLVQNKQLMEGNVPEAVLEKGEMKILDEQYHYDLYTEGALFTEGERGLITGGQAPACTLVKQLEGTAGLGNKSRVQIYYFEDVSRACASLPCGGCMDAKNLSAEQKQLLQGFTDRSYAGIRFLKPRDIQDTTSRYVDTEPKAQPAEKTVPVVVGPVKDATVEKRLETLKNLFDKGLISKEDYEKKKAEILNEL